MNKIAIRTYAMPHKIPQTIQWDRYPYTDNAMTLATVARTPDNPTKMPCSKKPIVPPTGRRL